MVKMGYIGRKRGRALTGAPHYTSLVHTLLTDNEKQKQCQIKMFVNNNLTNINLTNIFI